MELRQLEYFVTVAEEAGFTRAAARLHVAQPGISAQIKQLERELGQALFDRSGRTVRLTGAGRAVLPYARAALDAVAGARLAADELTGLVRGRVAIGTVTSLGGDMDVPGLLAGFRDAHPGVDITLAEDTSDRLLAGLADGRYDLAFAGLAGEAPDGIGTQVLIDDALVAAVAPSDPLARRRSIPVRELAGRPLIVLPTGTGLRGAADAACAAAGFRARVAFEAGNPEVLAALAERGLGVALLPAGLAAARPGLRSFALTSPSVRSRLVLAWRTSAPSSPAATAFLTHARTFLAAQRPRL
ncbi:DNA-binding transcriptional regulator, LysR family [Actinacidiphila alni]|uniref:DNA-binding transcriptional regulator, LysR family n=1 Tax=Actinacidiphila alni TaxID=380248 RepID=A0A1I2M1J6_9ACTN|nr:LysR substrate-binding domain-containing protein [Actinacidiphila alni]SFF85385.1 DNA-binding transcriptional regulator, LysR family [Actinacidiphila alni]